MTKPATLTPDAEAELFGELCNISFRDHHDWPFIDPDDGDDPQLHTCERAREAAWHIMAILEKAGLIVQNPPDAFLAPELLPGLAEYQKAQA